MERAEAAIVRHAGATPRPYFRPPYGDYDQALTQQLRGWGYTYAVMWTVDSLGWKGLSAEEITIRCLERAEPAAVFLFQTWSRPPRTTPPWPPSSRGSGGEASSR